MNETERTRPGEMMETIAEWNKYEPPTLRVRGNCGVARFFRSPRVSRFAGLCCCRRTKMTTRQSHPANRNRLINFRFFPTKNYRCISWLVVKDTKSIETGSPFKIYQAEILYFTVNANCLADVVRFFSQIY